MTAYTKTVGANTTSVTRTFDWANRLLNSVENGSITTGYGYDDNGNLVFIDPPDGNDAVYYSYNQRSLLTEARVTMNQITIAEYLYDGDGNRVRQVDYTGAQPVTTTYANDNLGLSQVLIATNGTTQTANLYGLDLISQDDGAQTRTLLADGLGSGRQEMANGAIETATTYEPYGNILAQTGTSGTTYAFTGEQFDGSAGLLYLRARYYNPGLKLFMSRDPFPGYAYRPSTQHDYAYVGNNPVNKVDPTGKIEQWWENMLRDPAWRQVLLDSSIRHNQQELTGLDDTGFAAVLASVILIESKDIGGSNPSWFKRTIGNIVNPMPEKWRIPIIMQIKSLEIIKNRLFAKSNESEGICNIDPAITEELAQYPEILVHVYGPGNPSPLEETGNGCTFPGVSCEGNSITESYSSAYDPDPVVRRQRQLVVAQTRQDNYIELLAAKFEMVAIRLRNAGIDGSLPDPTPLRNSNDAQLTVATRNFAQFHARGIMESLGNSGHWWLNDELIGIKQAGDVQWANDQENAQTAATNYFHLIRLNWQAAYNGLSSVP